MTTPSEPTPPRRGSGAAAWAAGTELAFTVLACCAAGWWISKKTGEITWLIAFGLVGVVLALYRFVRSAMKW